MFNISEQVLLALVSGIPGTIAAIGTILIAWFGRRQYYNSTLQRETIANRQFAQVEAVKQQSQAHVEAQREQVNRIEGNTNGTLVDLRTEVQQLRNQLRDLEAAYARQCPLRKSRRKKLPPPQSAP